jgi:hypothetical protein
MMYLRVWLIIVNNCSASHCTERCAFVQLIFTYKCAWCEYVSLLPKTREVGYLIICITSSLIFKIASDVRSILKNNSYSAFVYNLQTLDGIHVPEIGQNLVKGFKSSRFPLSSRIHTHKNHTHTHTHTHIYIYIYLYICICVWVCVEIDATNNPEHKPSMIKNALIRIIEKVTGKHPHKWRTQIHYVHYD